MTTVRPPAVAGMFYPGEPGALASDVARMLGDVRALRGEPAERRAADGDLRAVIAPHAGYVYSGPTAAHAYDAVAAEAGRCERVILLGPTHRVAVDGLALPGADALDTPLGLVEVDAPLAALAASLPHVTTSARVHELEHSLEVHLPFLQTVLPGRPVLPLAVGRATAVQVADVLEALLDDPAGAGALVVVSSDLSHYLPYDRATEVDEATAHRILALDTDIDHHRACGATPMVGLLELARRRGWRPALLDLCNSGDTAGDRDRVVGYAALTFRAGEDGGDGRAGEGAFDDAADDAGLAPDPALAGLPGLARAAIRAHLAGEPAPSYPDSPELEAFELQAAVLQESGAAFVTLTNSDGSLRGCIGSLEAYRPLGEDVAAHAIDAAVNDPRFPAVTADELDGLHVEVSVLSAPEPLTTGAGSTEAEALAMLRPGVDGIILAAGPYRATFLPQVWDQLPDPRTFLDHLRRKAGLPPGYWGPEVELQRYTATEYHEERR